MNPKVRAADLFGLGILCLIALSGCHRGPALPTGTGARETVQSYYQAILKRDWPAAYDLLDSASRKRCTSKQFVLLAQAYRRNLGFEPEQVHVQACEEESTVAFAHVVLSGRTATEARRYRDALTLHPSADGWRVVLPRMAERPGQAVR